MQKIPTLFTHGSDRRYVTPTVTPGCEWVINGEGRATRKWNGACILLDEAGAWWTRREVKPGKTPPSNYRLSHGYPTGKTVGWEPAFQSSFARYLAEALATSTPTEAGTYELLGPAINGNLDTFREHVLVRHGWTPYADRLRLDAAPRDFKGIRTWLLDCPYKGIVWHRHPGRPDTQMAKLKVKNFPRQPAN